jgi:ABC-type sugar transport system ATPase subunit
VPALQVSGMTIPGCVDGVDITVEPGEIVGIAGLVGAGRSELLEGIFGLRAMSEGTIEINGKPIQARSPRAAIREGLGFLPPDRKQQGLVLQRTIDENLTMVATLGRSRWRAPGGAEVERKAEEVSKTMRLRAASRQALVSTLSGGNQQKVAVGKWLMADPQVLMLDEPTRGVDVAAKSEIHELLRNVASTGVGLLVVSSENEELIQLSDRILIMFSGRIVASVPATEADVPTIARYAGGHI